MRLKRRCYGAVRENGAITALTGSLLTPISAIID